MNVVWYAIGIYVVGVAVVLYVRPAVMFHPGGAWKEFGVSKEGGYTVFPFWMFAMVWSLVSYAFATPIRRLIFCVGNPREHAPYGSVVLLVTYG